MRVEFCTRRPFPRLLVRVLAGAALLTLGTGLLSPVHAQSQRREVDDLTWPPLAHTYAPDLGTWSIGRVEIPLTATGGNGTYTWSLADGSLPPGLSLRDDPPFWAASETLAGVATTAGIYTFTLRVTSGTAFADQIVTITITALIVKDGDAAASLPEAFVGEPYVYQVTALNAAGDVTFEMSAGVPDGLTLSADGIISGTPTTEGNFFLPFSVSDGVDRIWYGLSLPVAALQITTPAVLPNAQAGAAYSTTLTAAGGTPPYTFSACCVTGLALSTDGTLSGDISPFMPRGPTRLLVTVGDANNLFYRKWMSLDIVDDDAPRPLIDATRYANGGALDDCTVGMSCARAVAVAGGGVAPYTWVATGLPPGMSIRPATGSDREWISIAVSWSGNPTAGDAVFWGVPTAAGTFRVNLAVYDAVGNGTTQIMPLRVANIAQTTWIPNGAIDQPYAEKIRPLGGTLPYTSVLSRGTLPAGLTFDPSTLLVSGVPIESGGFNPVFTLTDANGDSVTLTNSMSVDAPIDIFGVTTFADSHLPVALLDVPYSYQFFGCCAPAYSWSIVSGTLPPGMTVNSNGLLSGATVTPGTYTFVVRLEDPASPETYSQRQFTLDAVTAPLIVTGGLTLPGADVGTWYSTALTAVGGNAALVWTVAAQNLLPRGFTLTSDGILAGGARQPGSYCFTVNVTDGVQTTTATFVLTIRPPWFGPGGRAGSRAAGLL